MKAICVGIVIGLVGMGTMFGYGNAGHQAVGSIAGQYLVGTRAGREVQSLLGPREDLARASTWADRAKLPEKYLTIEMKEFVANNPDHQQFHYCDVPFQEKAYRAGLIGTNDKDIVHTLRKCIEVLQSPDPQPANPLRISKRVALMLLVHLIGDLHQPLHVGCGYIDEKDEFVNPETGAKGLVDAGANFLRLNAQWNLHGYWDIQTVKFARDRAGAEDFVSYLIRNHPAKADWMPVGPVVTWPEKWATDSLSAAKCCYHGLKLGPRFSVPANDRHEEHFEWMVTLPSEYAERSCEIVEAMLSQAGFRLAALLAAIWPE